MKQPLLTFGLCAFAWVAVAQPANDNCGSAIPLSAGTICNNGNNIAATLEAMESAAPLNQQCWASVPDNTVWYTFTPAASGNYVISMDNRVDADGSSPDTQIKLLSGTCGAFSLLACSEDNGLANGLAARVTASLTAGVTYYIQADIYGTTQGSFCMSVYRLAVPSNDCINNAIDITALINSVSPSNPYSCNHGYIYNAPGGTTADDPSRQDVLGDPNGCNGYSIFPTTNPDHRDVWFKFTVSGATPPAYLQLFPDNINFTALWIMGLYSGTPVSTCPTGTITGLTYIDCSAGVLVDVPPGNDKGGVRDQSLCTTPVHPRIAINGLASGTYYIRVWDFGGGTPGEGIFNLCAESIAPRPNSLDTCGSANIGYLGSDFNASVNSTYSSLSNAGAHGNSCTTAPNEPLLGATPAGQARVGCGGPWVTYVGAINNVMNNTMIHSFRVSSCPGCEPTAIVQLNNIERDGTPGNVAQLQVMAPNNCTGSTQTIMNGMTSSSCIEMRVASNAPLPNGQYYIVVDGQDGQLLNYDLTLTLTYPCPQVPVCFVLPVELLSFTGENVEGKNRLEWITASEVNNNYFDVERSRDGNEFFFLKRITGAGSSIEERQYVTFDTEPFEGISYYRLRQTDYDGTSTLSDVISIKNDKGRTHLLQVYPDGDQLIVRVFSEGEEDGSLRILDMTGRGISREVKSRLQKGMNEIRMDVGS